MRVLQGRRRPSTNYNSGVGPGVTGSAHSVVRKMQKALLAALVKSLEMAFRNSAKEPIAPLLQFREARATPRFSRIRHELALTLSSVATWLVSRAARFTLL
jgi:hypothetical protein